MEACRNAGVSKVLPLTPSSFRFWIVPHNEVGGLALVFAEGLA